MLSFTYGLGRFHVTPAEWCDPSGHVAGKAKNI